MVLIECSFTFLSSTSVRSHSFLVTSCVPFIVVIIFVLPLRFLSLTLENKPEKTFLAVTKRSHILKQTFLLSPAIKGLKIKYESFKLIYEIGYYFLNWLSLFEMFISRIDIAFRLKSLA